MAITKEHKQELVNQYQEWLQRSQAVYFADYLGVTVKDLDALRQKVREVGGEFHIVKNTLSKIAFEAAGYPVKGDLFQGATAVGFAFEDIPALAKALKEFANSSDFVRLKGGYLGTELLTAADIEALAELPPLPVVRARLLGTLMAPASQLARLISEPARQLAQVVKAYADQQAAA